MPRAATYCRVSSEEQAQKDLSIPAQKKELARWLDQNPDHELVAEFVDEGISAFAPAHKRPGFCDMIARCKARDIDVILVHKLDRFSRNLEESVVFKSMLRRNNAQVRSITENYNSETPQGFLMEGIVEVFNQYFSMNLANEVRKGLRENAERGYWNGSSAPYGYAIEHIEEPGTRKRRKLVLGPPEQVAVVRTIYELSIQHGHGAPAISKFLNEQGIPSAKGGGWSIGSVYNVLSNPVYAGDLVWNRRRKLRNGSQKWNEDKDLVIVRDAFPAIVARELFERQQVIFRQRDFPEQRQVTRPVKYLLSRLIHCQHCGSRFCGERRDMRRTDKVIHYGTYRCSGHRNRGPAVCPGVTLRKDWIEGVVLDEIRKQVCTSEAQKRLQAIVAARIEAARSRVGKDARALQSEIDRLDKRIENYYRAIGDGMAADECRRFIQEATDQKQQLLRESEELRRDDRLATLLERNGTLLASFGDAFDKGFQQLPFGAQRQIILQLVERIDVIQHEIVRVHLRVPFDNQGLRVLSDPEAAAALREGDAQQLVEAGGSVGRNGGSDPHRIHAEILREALDHRLLEEAVGRLGVEVLAGRLHLDAGRAQLALEEGRLFLVPAEAVELVDDQHVHLVLRAVVDHLDEAGALLDGRVGALALVDELADQLGAFLGDPAHEALALGGDGEVFEGLLLGGHAEVGHGALHRGLLCGGGS